MKANKKITAVVTVRTEIAGHPVDFPPKFTQTLTAFISANTHKCKISATDKSTDFLFTDVMTARQLIDKLKPLADHNIDLSETGDTHAVVSLRKLNKSSEEYKYYNTPTMEKPMKTATKSNAAKKQPATKSNAAKKQPATKSNAAKKQRRQKATGHRH